MQVGHTAFGFDVVGQLLHEGNDHLTAGLDGEEGRALAAPVVVHGKAGQIRTVYLAGDVDELLVQVGGGLEQLLEGVLLLLVDQRHGGVLEAHEGDQALEPCAVEEPHHVGLAVFEILPVVTAALVPIPGINVGELEDRFPVVGVAEGMGDTRLFHGTAHHGDEHPFDAKHIRAAIIGRIPLVRLDDEAAGDVVGDDLRAEDARLGAHQEVVGLALVNRVEVGLALGYRRVEDGNALSVYTTGCAADDFQFLGVKTHDNTSFLFCFLAFRLSTARYAAVHYSIAACTGPPQ